VIRPLIKISHKTLVVFLESLAVIVLLAAIAFGAFIWRMSQGPLSIGFAKDYVQEALSTRENNFTVAFDDIVFSWPNVEKPFELELTGLRVRKGGKAASTLKIEKATVGLARGPLLFGRIRPVSMRIEAPSLALVRTPDGRLSLVREQEGETPQTEDGAGAQEEIAQIFRNMARNERGSLLGRLDEFEIRNARVDVRDQQAGLTWHLTSLNFTMEERKEGVAASLVVPLPGRGEEEGGLTLDMAYRKETDDFRAAGQVKDINPSFISRFLSLPGILDEQDLYFSGEVDAALDKDLQPVEVKFKGAVPEGSIMIPDEYDAPIALKDMAVEGAFDAAKKSFSLSRLSGDLGGIPFSGAAQAVFTQESIFLPAKLNIESVDVAKIPPLFPKSEKDGQAYHWLGDRISKGTFKNAVLEVELSGVKLRDEEAQKDKWDFTMGAFTLDFGFEDADVLYQETLMPATAASGKGRLDLGEGDRLDITNGKAMIGDMAAENVSVSVTNLMKAGAGDVEVKGKLNGPVATALEYIAAEPINMGRERIGIDYKGVKGNIAADLSVALPTVKDVPKEAVHVSITGDMTELNIPGLVKGLPLSGGPLRIETSEGGFTVKGKAQLAGRDTTVDWHQYFESKGNPYSMRVAASIGADQELRNHFGVDLDDYISGTMPVDVVYTSYGGGKADVEVKGDLNPVRVHIDTFKFDKPVGMPGSVTAKAYLEKDALKEIRDIEIKSRDFSVSNAALGFAARGGKTGVLDRGKLPGVTIGKTKADVTFTTDKEGALYVMAKADVFDLMPFLTQTETSSYGVKAEKEKRQPMKIALDAKKMLAKNEQSAADTKTYLEIDDEGDITRLEYDAKVGKGNMFVRFRPDETGKRTFRLETNDAGGTLYTFGLYDKVFGGKLIIYGEPKQGDMRGNLYGTMRMENFRVKNAPALASLLSLMSLSGLGQALGDQGLVFSKLESGFEWRFRPEGNLLIIKDGTTSGSSIGLTFSGVIDRGKKTTDIAGTIIPMSEINSFLSKIPLVGNLLSGGLIAATYSMKGPTSDPRVSVNPLSVLAPGIIRRILFEDGYENKIPGDDEEEEPAVKKAPAQVN
jgi:hypothetical protein